MSVIGEILKGVSQESRPLEEESMMTSQGTTAGMEKITVSNLIVVVFNEEFKAEEVRLKRRNHEQNR